MSAKNKNKNVWKNKCMEKQMYRKKNGMEKNVWKKTYGTEYLRQLHAAKCVKYEVVFWSSCI